MSIGHGNIHRIALNAVFVFAESVLGWDIELPQVTTTPRRLKWCTYTRSMLHNTYYMYVILLSHESSEQLQSLNAESPRKHALYDLYVCRCEIGSLGCWYGIDVLLLNQFDEIHCTSNNVKSAR